MVPLLNDNDLQHYGKNSGEIWWVTTESIRVDEKDVCVEKLCPYEIPWNKQRGPRPSDYFDKIETRLSYHDPDRGNAHFTLIISGKGREENIEVFKDSVKLDLENQAALLSMNKTFEIPLMYSIMEALNAKLTTAASITPYIEVFNKDLDQMKAEVVLEKTLEPYLKKIIESHEPGSVIIPIVARSDRQSSGHHWYCVLLEWDPHKNPTITIIDSTNKSKKKLLKDIKEDYIPHVINPVNQVLSTLHSRLIKPEDIRYSEVLQYGNMGCGITAIQTIDDLASGSFRGKTFADQDIRVLNESEGWVLYVKEREEGILLTGQQYDRIMDGDSLDDVLGENLTYSMVSKETDVELVNDRAIRRTVVSEGLRRVSLALAEEERAQLIQKYQGARASHRELMMEMKSNPEFKIARSKADAIELTPQQIMKNVVHDIRDPQKTDRNLDDDAITRN